MLSHAMPVQWQRSGSGPSLWPHAPCSQHQSCHTRRVVAFRAWRDWLSSVVGPDQSGPQQTGTAPSPTLPPEVAVPPLPPRRDFLEARQVSLYQLFDGAEYKFDIPPYQRNYSWGIKQVHEMLQDFLASFHARNEYFLGAIVTVKAGDGPGSPLQVIDGQQRLTSLLILLAFVYSWAKQNGSQVLEARIKRLLYIEADPLDAHSQGRFRLQLKGGDDEFYLRNMLQAYLPTQFYLSGVPTFTPSVQPMQPFSAEAQPQGMGQARPLENETWWRMYENAAYVRTCLTEQTARGLNLQDFVFHVLKNCHVVLMTARDEASSFRIFSALNSRGMDLSMVDKLKADLLEVLDAPQRRHWAAAWTEMEDILGRVAFHRVFDYMRSLALILNPEVQHLSVLEYFTQHQRREPIVVATSIGVALDYGRILLQLRQCRFEITPGVKGSGGRGAVGARTTPGSIGGVLRLLADDGQGGIVTTLDNGGPSSSVTTHGAIRALERQARHMAMFSDDSWLPSTLEFFRQEVDMDTRTAFLLASETLQLFLEACADAAVATRRWGMVAAAVVARGRAPGVGAEGAGKLEAIFVALALTPEDKALFRTRLAAKDLLALVPSRTLAHLLLRAEGASVSTSPTIDFTSLHVDKIVPANPPEGSQWRRNKLWLEGIPAPTSLWGQLDTASMQAAGRAASRGGGSAAGAGGGGTGQQGPPSHTGAEVQAVAGRRGSTGPRGREGAQSHRVGANGGGGRGGGSPSGSPVPTAQGQRGAGSIRRSPTANGGGSNAPLGEVKYWFEAQRSLWHGKLGNQVLVPGPRSAAVGLADADYDAKAAHFASCGVAALLPEWSGSVLPGGRFGHTKFSFEECKSRHVELLTRLVEVLRLTEGEEEERWWEGEEDEEGDVQASVY